MTSPTPPDPADSQTTHPRAETRAAGAMLMVVGGMIAVLCGLCTLTVLAPNVVLNLLPRLVGQTPQLHQGDMDLQFSAPAFGGVPALIGVAIAVRGYLIWRRARSSGLAVGRGGQSSDPAGEVLGGGCLMAIGGAAALSLGTALIANLTTEGISLDADSFVSLAIAVGGVALFLIGLAVFTRWRPRGKHTQAAHKSGDPPEMS